MTADLKAAAQQAFNLLDRLPINEGYHDETVEVLDALRAGLAAQAPAEGDEALAERLRDAYHSKTRIGHPMWKNLDTDRKEPWLAVARAARPNVQPKGTAAELTDVQIADAATGIKPYPVELAQVPAAQTVAFARAVIAADRALQAPAPAPEVGAGEKWEADVECITDESGTDYSVSIRGPGLRNPDYSDVWLKKRPAEQLAKWLNKSVLPRFSAPAVKDDEPEWELPTPAVGDYVLATKWSDGDPGDNWALGFYTHSDTLQGNEQTRRYYVADSAGKNIRGNGFRKVHGPIRGDVGRWLLEVASGQLEASPPGVVNLWTMLTPFAFDLERDREPVSKPPVQGGQP